MNYNNGQYEYNDRIRDYGDDDVVFNADYADYADIEEHLQGDEKGQYWEENDDNRETLDMLVDEVVEIEIDADDSVHHIYDKNNSDIVDIEVDTDIELPNTPNEEHRTKKNQYVQCKTPETRL